MKKYHPASKEATEQAATLRRCFPVGSTVYGIVRSISRSGMSRNISIVAMNKEGFPSWPNWAVSVLAGYSFIDGPNTAVRSNGCGFNHLEAIKEGIETALGYKAGDLSCQYL